MSSENETRVRASVESLFPNRSTRLMALEILAGCIYEANCFGRSSWWVEWNQGELELLVNGIAICRLGEGMVQLALDKGLWEKSHPDARTGDVWTWDEMEQPEADLIDARCGWYSPDENHHDEFWSWARLLSTGAIFSASQIAAIGSGLDLHSHAVLRYLRNELNHHVPDPLID